jgi:hypothetical protein
MVDGLKIAVEGVGVVDALQVVRQLYPLEGAM